MAFRPTQERRTYRRIQFEALEKRALLTTVAWSSLNVPGSGGRMDAISVQPGNSDSVLISGDMLSVGFTRDGGDTWQGNFQGLENYQAADFTWDPNTSNRVWVGTHGGPHVSDDAGATWTQQRVGMPTPLNGQVTAPIEKVLFDPNDPEQDRLLAFVGDHREFGSSQGEYSGRVWISANDGDDWTESYIVAPDGNITDAEYLGQSGQMLMATVANQGVFFSDDDGLSWTPKNNGLPANLDALSITAHPTNENIAWITIEGDGVFYTDDSGDNWTARNNGLTLGPDVVRYKSIELANVDAAGIATLYAANAPDGGSGEGIYKSEDSGQTWMHVLTNASEIENYQVFAEGANPWWLEVDVNDPETIWAGSSARVIRSQDGGTTWKDMLNDPTPTPEFYVGRGFQGWVSSNFEINPFNPSHQIAQAWDSGKIMQSFDAGQTWTRNVRQATNQLTHRVDGGNAGAVGSISPFGGGQDVAFATPDLIYAAVGQSASSRPDILRSLDAGTSWTTLPYPAGLDLTPEALHVNANNPGELWFVTDGGLYQSLNADANDPLDVSWQQADTTFATKLYRLETDPFEPSAFYLSTDTGVYYYNTARQFQTLAGSPTNVNSGGDMKLTADPHVPGRVYLANFSTFMNSQRGLWQFDSSSGWTRLFDDNWVRDIAMDPLNPDRIALTTDKAPYGDLRAATGVWISQDGGDSWENVNDGLPMLRGQHISFGSTGNRLYIGLTGRGFYQTSLTDLTCDFDGDGLCDGTDIDLLQANLVNGPMDPATYDVTGDGMVTIEDRDEWLTQAGAVNLTSGNAYLPGDANLDGVVDGQDFTAWNDNKFALNAAWTAGDFNADGAVDGGDFLIWNDNKFTSADALVSPIFSWHDRQEKGNHEQRESAS